MRRAALTLLLLACAAPTTASAQYRVVNGRPATPDDLRATVALIDDWGELRCSGTLVTPSVVATAAHCVANEFMTNYVDASALRVLIGTLDLTQDPIANLDRSREIEAIHPECGWLAHAGAYPDPTSNGLGRQDDIAFLQLAEPVPAAVMTPVAVLPPERRQEIAIGTPLTVTGYGIYDVDTRAGGVLHTGEVAVEELTEHELMTQRSPDASATDSCNGDSGGPLYYLDANGETFLVGVTSRAPDDSTGDCGDGGIYARPDAYHQLLEQARGGEPRACDPGQGVLDEPTVDGLHQTICSDICGDGAVFQSHAICRACRPIAVPPGGEDPTSPGVTPMSDPMRARVGCLEPAMEEGGCSVSPSGGASTTPLALLGLLGLALMRRRRK